MTLSSGALMSAGDSILVCIDVQTKLCPAMCNLQNVLKNGTKLLRGAKILGVPIVVTEQYPKGMGPTIDTFLIDLPAGSIVEKMTFSSVREPKFMERLDSFAPRRQIVLFGTEAHVCVLQTALDLVDHGWPVFVVEDALSSRGPGNEHLAVRRMAARGVQIVGTEMVLFEWLEGKRNAHFKDVQKLIV